jgi:hypothetical protein
LKSAKEVIVMKKLISVLLAVCFIGAMACGLVGCEKPAAPVEDTTVADTVVTEDPTEETTATDTEVESDTGDVDTTETTVDSGAETTAEETNPETDSTEDTTVTE